MSETKALRDKSASRLNPINHVYVLLRGKNAVIHQRELSVSSLLFFPPGNAEYFLHELPFHFEVRKTPLVISRARSDPGEARLVLLFQYVLVINFTRDVRDRRYLVASIV
ncbi:hypothetical protein CDAR_429221 [Caerostris darwini]|uniref:Uncharacterized protein n=1 Tax=Caerostris darwini TaxID=1538125 RepID=A0AAV4PPC2_9ARAC|nr:hypothetical protein CDAR_429221 [Caerostris darwini]